jgi:hypothetical protein
MPLKASTYLAKCNLLSVVRQAVVVGNTRV